MLRYTFWSTLLWSENRQYSSQGEGERERLILLFSPQYVTVWLYLLTDSCSFAVSTKGCPWQSRMQLYHPWRCHPYQSEMPSPSVSEPWCPWFLHPKPQAGCSLQLMCWVGTGHDIDMMPKQSSYLAQQSVAATHCCHWYIACQGGSSWFCHSSSCTHECQRWEVACHTRSGIWNVRLVPCNTVCSGLKRHAEQSWEDHRNLVGSQGRAQLKQIDFLLAAFVIETTWFVIIQNTNWEDMLGHRILICLHHITCHYSYIASMEMREVLQ